jgi:lipopolysaccharide export LptBFGC system permease protein LptF
MLDNNPKNHSSSAEINTLARIILAAFLLTFMLARVIVFLIMSRTIPDLYLHLKGTHLHHLNFGIFLLSAVGAYLIFGRPEGKKLSVSAGIYGVAMALTFDEFGMWLHLDMDYWQRASWDAVVVLSALFALIAFASSLKKFRPRHWLTAIFLIVVLAVFLFLFTKSFKYAGNKLGPKLHQIESTAPK